MVKHLMLLLLVFGCVLNQICVAEKLPDLQASASVASDYKVQSVASGSSGKYGYPYLIAPTLAPAIQARSDNDENEAIHAAKSYGRRISATTDEIVKKGSQKKSKASNAYGATRRQDGEDISIERLLRNYREPKYRNFDELEIDFLPRRMDVNVPYSQYEYTKLSPKPLISPRDPYLSPSAEPIDTFYPTVPKIKTSYSTSSYGNPGTRGGPSYGAGRYEDPVEYHGGSYGGPSPSYPSSGGPSPSYPSGGSSPNYPSGGSYGYHDDYSIKSNEPIMGNIRKKLLDYAGASDLYEGEPDYLREVARNKYKYGSLGNDYYTYGGQGYRDSYREFPYVESKISLIKKSRRL